MQPPPLHIPLISKKRVFMDPDVIEIPPPEVCRTGKQPKHKQIILQEVIDVDVDEDYADVMIPDNMVDSKDKGKVIKDTSDWHNQDKEDFLASHLFGPSNSSAPESHTTRNLNCFFSDWLHEDNDNDYDSDGYVDFSSDDVVDPDQYAYLQAHFDTVDIPSGIEAPIPWLPDYTDVTEKTVNENYSSSTTSQIQSGTLGSLSSKPVQISKKPSSVNSGFQIATGFANHASGLHLSLPWSLQQLVQGEKKPTASLLDGSTVYVPPSQNKKKSAVNQKKKLVASSSSTNHSSANHFQEPMFIAPALKFKPFNLNDGSGASTQYYPGASAHIGGLNDLPLAGPKMPLLTSSFDNSSIHANFYDSFHDAHMPPEESAARTPENINDDDIMRKFQLFKQFDTVKDHSDHHYNSKGNTVKQPSKNWAKRIQEEWRILENDLPDSIFIRVYETRMDLLRAVIIGAEGTPYHDGLFFFDIFFPSGYPNVPPHVYYHSGGLRLNPNLYGCGKVCLSLLGTWHGNKNEKWLPGVSTVLQVLVSIQALILNQKPFFNEPGYERMSGSADGEIQSQQYNENTFIFSLKTMVYTMRRPPKHFEDFIWGHFHERSRDILVACKAYMDGAQVGCLVKGGVQDVDQGDRSCSRNFKDYLPSCVDMLAKEFSRIGVKNCEQFQTVAQGKKDQAADKPKAAM